MTTIVDQLKKEAEELSKQASYLDEVNTVALSEIANHLGISKSAGLEDASSSQSMMEAIKNELLDRSESPQFSNSLDRVHTPEQLIEALKANQFQIKMAAAQNEASADDTSSDSLASHKDELKQAAVQELVQNGVDRDKAENLVNQQLESAGEQ